MKKTLFNLISLGSIFLCLNGSRVCHANQTLSEFCKPLEKMTSFSTATFCCLNSEILLKKMEQIYHNELEKLGTVKNITIPDPTGFIASSNILYLTVVKTENIDEKSMPIIKMTLSLNTSVEISSTKVPCELTIWQRECFLNQKDVENPEKLQATVAYLLDWFGTCYQKANLNTKARPTFYFNTLQKNDTLPSTKNPTF